MYLYKYHLYIEVHYIYKFTFLIIKFNFITLNQGSSKIFYIVSKCSSQMLAKNKWYVQFRYKLMNCRFSIDWIEVLLLLFNFQNTLNKIVLICFKPWWLKLKQFRKRTLDLSLSLLVACSDKGFLYACTYIINVFISHKSLSSKLLALQYHTSCSP